jgi:predicted DNA-binding protein (UPF0251 family)
MTGYKPFGMEHCSNEPVKLKFEEFESIRMIDYRLLSQDEAAKEMDISRPTFTRLYNGALKNIAKAFAEGRCIEIEGGNYSLEKEWYRCKKCKKVIEGIDKHTRCNGCNSFNNSELLRLNRS